MRGFKLKSSTIWQNFCLKSCIFTCFLNGILYDKKKIVHVSCETLCHLHTVNMHGTQNIETVPVVCATLVFTMKNSGNSSLSQIELISLWISEQILLRPALINSAGIWSIPGDFYLLSFSLAISTSKALGSGTSCFAVCVSVCLTSLSACTFSSLEK